MLPDQSGRRMMFGSAPAAIDVPPVVRFAASPHLLAAESHLRLAARELREARLVAVDGRQGSTIGDLLGAVNKARRRVSAAERYTGRRKKA